MLSGGFVLIKSLEKQGTERIFCVPGESFLPVLDALHESPIDTVVARHEGGAAMMAEADGKLTGRPGIALVTRGPGAANAAAGVHVAQQDSTPLVLLVGQVARGMRGRDAFQEVDYQRFFGGMAKSVTEVDDAASLAQTVAEAFRAAMEGRPGPVVVSLPEDVLYETAPASIPPRVEPDRCCPSAADIEKASSMLDKAERPMVVAGGSVWDAEGIAALDRFAESRRIPVACSFRRQRLMDNLHPFYAGDLGLGCNPALLERIRASDCLVLLGGRLSEIPSQSYTLLSIPEPQMPLVHVHPDPAELGRVYRPALGIAAAPGEFAAAMCDAGPGGGLGVDGGDAPPCPEHLAWREWSDARPRPPGAVNMAEVVRWLRGNLPADSIVANGAGNYATWVHRFHHYRDPLGQLAPTSGSMGYGIPAAVAAKARFPGRVVVAFAGDGCFQMTMQELATARQTGAAIIVIVVDNGMYGTIRMHQEREFPGRASHTDLVNPDFAGLAESLGMHSEKVEKTKDFSKAFTRCLKAGKPALLHLPIDPEAITPTTTLEAIRKAASGR